MRGAAPPLLARSPTLTRPQINSANELVLTELILENTLAAYDPEEVVALLSCFVFQEKTEVEPIIPPKLQTGLAEIMTIAERVGAVQDRHRVAQEEFRALKPGLVEVIYEWAKGMVSGLIFATTFVLHMSFFSRSSRSRISRTSRKAPLFVSSHDLMRHVVR